MPGLTNKSKQIQNPQGPLTAKKKLANTRMLGKVGAGKNNVQNLAAHSQMLKFLNNNDLGEMLKDKIEASSKSCSSKVKDFVLNIAKDKLGYNGGLKHKLNIKSNPAGYDIRRFLKDKTRGWANNQVEDMKAAYQKEKYADIDNEQISDAEKQAKKNEFDNGQEVKTTFLRANLYRTLKADVVNRIEKEGIDIATEMDAKYLASYSSLISSKIKEVFSSDFEHSYEVNKSKNSLLSEKDLEIMAKNEAMAKVDSKIENVTTETFNSIKDSLEKEANEFVNSKRDTLIKSFGGTNTAIRANFDKVKADDYSSVENYVYEKDDQKAQASGVKSLNEMKEGISESVKGDASLANDANRSFRYLSKVAFSLVKNNGDTSSLETSVKIPVSPGVFVNIKVTGGVEKDDDHVTAKVNLGVGVSGEAGIAKLAGEVGGYMELKSKTPEDMAKLLSYTLYRQCRESKVVPAALTNKIWGMGGVSGKSSYDESEAFGANMENALFGQTVQAINSSKVGGYGKFSGEVQATDNIGVNFEVKGGAARDYSKKSFEATNQTERIGKMEPYKFGGQASKGQITGNFSINFEIGAFIGGGSAALEMKFRSGVIENVALKIGGKLKYSGSELTNESLKETIAMAVNSAASFLNSIVKGGINIGQLAKNKPANGTDISQSLVGEGGQVAFQAIHSGLCGKHLNEMLGKVESDAGVSNISEGSLALELAYEWEPGSTGTFSASLTSTSSIGVGVGVASFKAEKAQRILKWSTGGAGTTTLEKFKGGFSYI